MSVTNEELKLRCLELAIEQFRRAPVEDFRQGVAELQTWFYNRIIGSDSVELSQQPAGDKRRPGRPPKDAGQ